MSNIEYIFQADNPLGRNVIRTDIYHMAEQSRMLCVPGSDVEDRQYQIDITGFSINTCMWKEIDSCLGYVISITRKINEYMVKRSNLQSTWELKKLFFGVVGGTTYYRNRFEKQYITYLNMWGVLSRHFFSLSTHDRLTFV